MKKANALDWIALVLVIVGGLNWGLVGIFNFDLVGWLFIQTLNVEVLARIVYILVGVSAVYMIFSASKLCKS